MRIEFCVPLDPVAQPRVKAGRRGSNIVMYTPTKTSTGKSNGVAEYKSAIQLFAKMAYPGPPIDGPIRCDITFVFPRQSSKIWKTRPMPRYRHTQKPDKDNAEKAVLDALKGVLWVDDCQVCDGRTQKWHARGGELSHVLIVVETIPEEES